MNLGSHVVLTNAESFGILKCRIDETRDSAGPLGLAKAAKFRVEVHRPFELEGKGKNRDEGFEVEMRFILEKGSLETFRAVVSRVREEWELDLDEGSPGLGANTWEGVYA
jgi:serine/threonine-protein kinase HSL1, negative regulator of Swe1 kinase